VCDIGRGMSYIGHPARIWDTGWLRLVGSLKQQVSFAGCCLFDRALLQKRPTHSVCVHDIECRMSYIRHPARI